MAYAPHPTTAHPLAPRALIVVAASQRSDLRRRHRLKMTERPNPRARLCRTRSRGASMHAQLEARRSESFCGLQDSPTASVRVMVAGNAITKGTRVWTRDAKAAREGEVFVRGTVVEVRSEDKVVVSIQGQGSNVLSMQVLKQPQELMHTNEGAVTPGDHCSLVHINEVPTAPLSPPPQASPRMR